MIQKRALKRIIPIEKNEGAGDYKVSCPLFKRDVMVASACDRCKYFSGLTDGTLSNGSAVICIYRSFEKSSSAYDMDEVPAHSPDDITRTPTSLNRSIARDTIDRDLYQPDIEQLAEYYGFSLEDVVGE